MAMLEGIRVLELARFVAGPFCGQMLADHGAEVIKVESPGGGDGSRSSPPFWGDSGAEFYAFNRGKKSLCLSLRQEEGRDILRRLVAESDVIIEVNRPGLMDSLGLGYEACEKINKRIIYCTMTGYGSDGSMSQMGGHDINFMALAGSLELLGAGDSHPVIPPYYVSSMAGAANYACGAIAMALYQREKCGRGQYIEVSMYDSALSFMSHVFARRAGLNRLPRKGGEMLTGAFACYNIYKCADGLYLSLGAVEAGFWRRFCTGIRRPDLIERQWDECGQQEIINEVAAIMMTHDRRAWLEHFQGQDLCLTPLLDLDEAAFSELARERGLVQALPPAAPELPPLLTIAPPVRAPQNPARHSLCYPEAGEHTGEILAGLGFSPAEIQALCQQGIVQQSPER